MMAKGLISVDDAWKIVTGEGKRRPHMGFWGTGIFEGDGPQDMVCKIENRLKELAELEDDDALAALYILVDFCRHYGWRGDDFTSLLEGAKGLTFSNWEDPAERKAQVDALINFIESEFIMDGSGHNPSKGGAVDLVGKPVYHLTLAEHAQSIEEKGLEAKEPCCGLIRNEPGIYVSDSLEGCLKWQVHVTGYSPWVPIAIVKFVVSEEDLVFQDTRVDMKKDYRIGNSVAADRIQILV